MLALKIIILVVVLVWLISIFDSGDDDDHFAY